MKIADILEIFNTAIEEASKNIEEDEPINCDVELFKWTDSTGVEHIIPDGSCVLCENCTDIWMNPPFNRVYYCECKLGKELEFRSRENCNDKFCSGYKREEKYEQIQI